MMAYLIILSRIATVETPLFLKIFHGSTVVNQSGGRKLVFASDSHIFN